MKRRQTKKALKKALKAVFPADQIDQLIRDCASLAYHVTNNTDFYAWFEHTGHVQWVEVRVTTKQNTGTFILNANISYRISEFNSRKYVLKRLNELRDKLQYILDHNEVPEVA